MGDCTRGKSRGATGASPMILDTTRHPIGPRPSVSVTRFSPCLRIAPASTTPPSLDQPCLFVTTSRLLLATDLDSCWRKVPTNYSYFTFLK